MPRKKPQAKSAAAAAAARASAPAPAATKMDTSTDSDNESTGSMPDLESFPASEATMTAEEAKERGNELYKSAEYREAIKMYTKAIELNPKEPAYLNNRAAAHIMLNSFKEGLDDSMTALKMDPKNPKYHLRAGKCYFSLGRFTDAERHYAAALEVDPSNATAVAEVKKMSEFNDFKTKAVKSLQQKHYNTAISFVDRALDLAPMADELKCLKAEAFLASDRDGEADRLVSGILRDHPSHSDALFVRGLIMYTRGDVEKAVQHYKRALQCDPDHERSRLSLKVAKQMMDLKEEGTTAFKNQDYATAVDLYSKALLVDPNNKQFNSKLFFNRAVAGAKLGNRDKAIEDCTAAIDADPEYVKAILKRAELYLDAERFQDAINDYETAKDKDPSNKDIREKLQQAKLELKKSLRKNYYKILEVEKTAGENEIKKAYKKMALKHHPDRVQGEEEKKAAEARFKEIGEAYNILVDPQKRARYDSGQDLEDEGGMGDHGFGGFDPRDIFAQMFAGGMGGGHRGHHGHHGHGHGGHGGFHFGGGFPGGFGGFGGYDDEDA